MTNERKSALGLSVHTVADAANLGNGGNLDARTPLSFPKKWFRFVATKRASTFILASLISLLAVFGEIGFCASPKVDLSEGFIAEDWQLKGEIVWKNTPAAAAPVLRIEFKSLRQKNGTVAEYRPMIDYHVHIFGEDGSEVPLTPAGQKAYNFAPLSIPIKILAPGQKLIYEVPLAEYFALQRGHPYLLKLRRYLTLGFIPREASNVESDVRLIYVDAPPLNFRWEERNDPR